MTRLTMKLFLKSGQTVEVDVTEGWNVAFNYVEKLKRLEWPWPVENWTERLAFVDLMEVVAVTIVRNLI